MTVTQQAFDKWVDKYYTEVMVKIDAGEFLWATFGMKTNNNNSRIKRRGVLLASIKNGKIARSYCHEDDKWNYHVGLAVAYARYMGVEIPQVEKTFLVSELAGKEIMIEGRRYYVTPYGNSYCIYAMDEYGQVYHLSRLRVVFEKEIVLKEND